MTTADKTWYALDVRGAPETQDRVVALLGEMEVTGFEELAPGHLVAYAARPWDAEHLAEALRAWGVEATLRAFEIPGEDWLEAWKESWKPRPLGERLFIVPAWLEAEPAPDGRMRVLVDPGMAFGTGTHETTVLAWELLERVLERDPPATLLDLGTGTAILAMGSQLVHPGLTVAATDCDGEALDSAAANLRLNPGASARGPGPGVLLVRSAGVPVRDGWARAAVVNMTAAEHDRVRAHLLPALASRAVVVLSGLLPHQVQDQVKWWLDRGFACRERRKLGEWTALLLARNSES